MIGQPSPVSRLGIDHANRLVFLAEKIDAQEMSRIGFLHEIVDDGALRPRALSRAGTVSPIKAATITPVNGLIASTRSPTDAPQVLMGFSSPRKAIEGTNL